MPHRRPPSRPVTAAWPLTGIALAVLLTAGCASTVLAPGTGDDAPAEEPVAVQATGPYWDPPRPDPESQWVLVLAEDGGDPMTLPDRPITLVLDHERFTGSACNDFAGSFDGSRPLELTTWVLCDGPVDNAVFETLQTPVFYVAEPGRIVIGSLDSSVRLEFAPDPGGLETRLGKTGLAEIELPTADE